MPLPTKVGRSVSRAKSRVMAARVCAVLVLMTAGLAQAQTPVLFPSHLQDPSRLIYFEVASQRLADALIAFALQGNLSIGVDDPRLAQGDVPRLSGLFTVHDGLRRLLQDSGLTYRFVDPVTVRIFESQSAMPVRRGVRRQPRLASAAR
jgi:hypothetical protein